jgi:prophage antirepressor-like protein
MTGTDLDLFAGAGDGLDPTHFGIDEHGRAYVVASVFAKAMGYRDAEKATRLLDAEEKGTQIMGTPGGDQRMSVIYEDGMWELIFRSTLPSAKSIKARVKAILRELRETGVVDTRSALSELSNRDFALRILAEADRADAAEGRVAELEPAAAAFQLLAGDRLTIPVGAAAKYFLTRFRISTGRNRLYDDLREMKWVFKQSCEPTQEGCERGVVEPEYGKKFKVRKTGEERQGDTKTRVTLKGMERLAKHFGVVPNQDDLRLFVEAHAKEAAS